MAFKPNPGSQFPDPITPINASAVNASNLAKKKIREIAQVLIDATAAKTGVISAQAFAKSNTLLENTAYLNALKKSIQEQTDLATAQVARVQQLVKLKTDSPLPDVVDPTALLPDGEDIVGR